MVEKRMEEFAVFKDELTLEAEVYFENRSNLETEAEALFRELERDILKKDFAAALEELAAAERNKDSGRAAELLKRCLELSKKMNK